MPTFISRGGIWEPAKERAFDPKTGEIYDGPDREAVRYIKAEGGKVGTAIEEDPQLIEIAEARRQTVHEYIAKHAPTPAQVQAKAEADTKIVTHADPIPKEGVSPSLGGFNADSEAPEEALLAKKRGRTKGA